MNKKNKEVKICTCKKTVIHDDIVENIRQKMLKEDTLNSLADFFKVLGDTTRIKIIYALFQSEMCVCDIASLLNMTQSAISHQLRVLKSSRFVKYRKEGKVVYYSLDDEHIKNIFDQGYCHINHIK